MNGVTATYSQVALRTGRKNTGNNKRYHKMQQNNHINSAALKQYMAEKMPLLNIHTIYNHI